MPKRRLAGDTSTDDDDYQNSSIPIKKSSRKANSRRQPAEKKAKPDLSGEDIVDGGLQGDLINTRPHSSTLHTISSPGPARIELLKWFDPVHDSRGMPWRKRYDPSLGRDQRAQRAYEVWISEIMLQQTQVVTVIPYYKRWMEKFPTIKDLAASDIESVNGLWKGLGYYSRAARLFSGAKKAVDEFDGRLPDNAKDLQKNIPGIGRYSAGAISSIAYNECVPVLDGNVNRLLSRVLALHAPPKAKSTLDILWSGATAMVEGSEHPGDLNQAMIELGSTVCKVRDPMCTECPLQTWCQAYQGLKGKGKATEPDFEAPDIEDRSARNHEKNSTSSTLSNGIQTMIGGSFSGTGAGMLMTVPWTGLLAGLHEFPTSPNVSTSTTASLLTNISHTLLSTLLRPPLHPYSPYSEKSDSRDNSDTNVLRITKIEPAGDVVHVFSHIKKTYRIQWVVLEGGGTQPPELAPDLRKSQKAKAGTTTSGKRKRKKGGGDSELSGCDGPTDIVAAKWTPLEQVSDANIGTGVLKVWKQAKVLWER